MKLNVFITQVQLQLGLLIVKGDYSVSRWEESGNEVEEVQEMRFVVPAIEENKKRFCIGGRVTILID